MPHAARLVLIACLVFLRHPAPCAGGPSAGLLPLPGGDWVVRTPVVLSDLTLSLRGNLIVRPPGSLTLYGVTLRIDGEHDGELGIRVEEGASLTAAPSPLTRRRTRITPGGRGGRYAFEVAPGGRLALVGATVAGAGWDDDHPGLVVDSPAPGDDGIVIVDCDFTDDFVGLTLRNAPATVAFSRFRSNHRAGMRIEGAAVRLSSIEASENPVGIVIGPGADVSIDGGFLSGNSLGIASGARSLEIAAGLLVDNLDHVRVEGGDAAAFLHDGLLLVASHVAVAAAGGADVRLRRNDLVFNRTAVVNENPGDAPRVDAVGNYWGAESGPGGFGGGDGDRVGDGVDFTPWCSESCRTTGEE